MDSVRKSEPAKEGDGSNRSQLFLRDEEVQLPSMIDDDKVVPFPPPAGSPEPEPIAKRHQRVILSIGSQRLAFDFYHQVTNSIRRQLPSSQWTAANREKGGSPASNSLRCLPALLTGRPLDFRPQR